MLLHSTWPSPVRGTYSRAITGECSALSMTTLCSLFYADSYLHVIYAIILLPSIPSSSRSFCYHMTFILVIFIIFISKPTIASISALTLTDFPVLINLRDFYFVRFHFCFRLRLFSVTVRILRILSN